jgi:hypothetical protein
VITHYFRVITHDLSVTIRNLRVIIRGLCVITRHLGVTTRYLGVITLGWDMTIHGLAMAGRADKDHGDDRLPGCSGTAYLHADTSLYPGGGYLHDHIHGYNEIR